MSNATSTAGPTLEYLAQDMGPPTKCHIWAVTCLSTIAVLVRIFTRWRLMSYFGLDDALICCAQVAAIAVSVIETQMVDSGIGRHSEALTGPQVVDLYKYLVPFQVTYFVALGLCRWSCIWFCHRIYPLSPYTKWLQWACALVTAVMVTQVLIVSLQCIPLATLWGAAEGTCMDSKVVILSTGVMTICCDTVILMLPMFIVVKMQGTWGRKVVLGAIMCCGLITSIIRLSTMTPIINNQDVSWNFAAALVWFSIELSVAIVALSLPTMKSLTTILLDKLGLKVRVQPTTQKAAESMEDIFLRYHDETSEGRHMKEPPRVYQGPGWHWLQGRASCGDPLDDSSQQARWSSENWSKAITAKRGFSIDIEQQMPAAGADERRRSCFV